jgi:hypothetical protein
MPLFQRFWYNPNFCEIRWVRDKPERLNGLAMFHMMKTTYIRHGPEHKKSWKVDLTIYSINAPDNDTQSSSTPVKNHENRMSTGSMKKSPAITTPKSDVKREVLSTPRRSTRV